MYCIENKLKCIFNIYDVFSWKWISCQFYIFLIIIWLAYIASMWLEYNNGCLQIFDLLFLDNECNFVHIDRSFLIQTLVTSSVVEWVHMFLLQKTAHVHWIKKYSVAMPSFLTMGWEGKESQLCTDKDWYPVLQSSQMSNLPTRTNILLPHTRHSAHLFSSSKERVGHSPTQGPHSVRGVLLVYFKI